LSQLEAKQFSKQLKKIHFKPCFASLVGLSAFTYNMQVVRYVSKLSKLVDRVFNLAHLIQATIN